MIERFFYIFDTIFIMYEKILFFVTGHLYGTAVVRPEKHRQY